MTTIRPEHRDRFTRIDRRTIEDKRLSNKSLGGLLRFLDKPDDWRITREWLAQAGPGGEGEARSILRELTDLGYLVRQPVRARNGTVMTETLLYEVVDDGALPVGTSLPGGDSASEETRQAGSHPADSLPGGDSATLTTTGLATNRTDEKKEAKETNLTKWPAAPSHHARLDESILFDDFWSRYPKQPDGRKRRKDLAWSVWKTMMPDRQDLALRVVDAYRDGIASSDESARHAHNWLRSDMPEVIQEAEAFLSSEDDR